MTSGARHAVARSLAREKSGLVRVVLAPAAAVYGFVARAKALAYERGLIEPRRLATPVVSVGNLTLGGTGKTPLVVEIARALVANGLDTAVLTRGYGRSSRAREVLRSSSGATPADAVERGGDEAAMLARQLDRVPIVVDADRAAAGAWAEGAIGPRVFVLDDGFQHYRLFRDVNVLVVDATDPFGGGATPPLGRLREPMVGAARADVVVVTRWSPVIDRDGIASTIRSLVRLDVPIFFCTSEIAGFRRIDTSDAGPLESRSVGVLTAIGNPDAFARDVECAGVEVVSRADFPDHHAFTRADVERAIAAASNASADALVTTEKDAVKLERIEPFDFPIFVARQRFVGDLDAFLAHVLEKVARAAK